MTTLTFRRRVRIETCDSLSRCAIEDDQHHYVVTVRHEHGRVTGVEVDSLRVPWTLCGNASAALDELLGLPITDDPRAPYAHTDQAGQCTHMLDAAALAIVAAGRGIAHRQYDVAVSMAPGSLNKSLEMWRDGAPLFTWEITDSRLIAAGEFTGRDLRHANQWPEAADPDMGEALTVVRRANLVSLSRQVNLDTAANAAFTERYGACYVYQPHIAKFALRVVGATRDFALTPDALLADLAPLATSKDCA